jgi:hypothetical protein
MRKTIALVVAVTLFMGSTGLNNTVRAATLAEYAVLLALISIISAADDLPQPQKDRLIRTVEG